MSVTPNLGLTLPAGSDWADVEVLNENWKKIDAAVLRAMAAAAAYDAGKTYQKGVLHPGRAFVPGRSGHRPAGGLDGRALDGYLHHGRDPGD